MIHEDPELVADRYRLNTASACLALRIMDSSASAVQQKNYAPRPTRAEKRLRQRAAGMNAAIVKGEVLLDGAVIVPMHTIEPAGWTSFMSREDHKVPSKQARCEQALVQQAPWHSTGVPRRVFIKGMQGIDVTLVVTVVQGSVWVSISPPFTWEAIMEPAKVDELVHVLELAKDEAKNMAVAGNGGPSRTGKAVVRAITGGPKK